MLFSLLLTQDQHWKQCKFICNWVCNPAISLMIIIIIFTFCIQRFVRGLSNIIQSLKVVLKSWIEYHQLFTFKICFEDSIVWGTKHPPSIKSSKMVENPWKLAGLRKKSLILFIFWWQHGCHLFQISGRLFGSSLLTGYLKISNFSCKQKNLI